MKLTSNHVLAYQQLHEQKFGSPISTNEAELELYSLLTLIRAIAKESTK